MTNAYRFLTALCLALFQQDAEAPQFESGGRLIWMMLQTLFVLAFVCALAYAVLRLLPRLGVRASSTSMVQVVDRTPLEPRKHLYVIKVTGRWLLISTSEAGVQLIQELDPQAAEAEAEALRTRTGAGSATRDLFADRLARLLKKRM